jgi:hypothetical protein
MKGLKTQYLQANTIVKIAGLFFFMLFATALHAQDANSDDVKNRQSQDPNMRDPQTKAQKKLAKEQKAKAKASKKAEKAALKEHMKHQTPEVRKRMKADAKAAKRNNEHKKEFFLTRWFRKKLTKK